MPAVHCVVHQGLDLRPCRRSNLSDTLATLSQLAKKKDRKRRREERGFAVKAAHRYKWPRNAKSDPKAAPKYNSSNMKTCHLSLFREEKSNDKIAPGSKKYKSQFSSCAVRHWRSLINGPKSEATCSISRRAARTPRRFGPVDRVFLPMRPWGAGGYHDDTQGL